MRQFNKSMKNNVSLTEQVMAYKENGEDWNRLCWNICLFIYNFCPSHTGWNEDICSDFFLYFHPRIKGMVERYEPTYSFDTYLASTVRWAILSFIESQRINKHHDKWLSEEAKVKPFFELPEKCFGINEINDILLEKDSRGSIADLTLRKRIIFAVLLSASDINMVQIPAIAKATNVETSWLYDKIESIKCIIDNKLEKRRKLKERRNECWFKMDTALTMISMTSKTNREFIWRRRANTWRRRYELASQKIKLLNTRPSHADIGSILQIPTGTVSSGLYFLRLSNKKIIGRVAEKRTGYSKNELNSKD